MSKRRRPFVAVETDVAKDESFAVLGDVCGYNRDEALGRIVRLWAWCADRKLKDAPDGCPGYAVSDGVVVRFLGANGVRGILGDGVAEFALGERWGDLIYLRGTDATVAARRSKIDGAVAGGEARAREILATAARGEDGKFVITTTVYQPAHHPEPAGSPPRTSVDPRSQIPDPAGELPPARDPAVQSTKPDATLHARPTPPPDPILPESQQRSEVRIQLIGRCWDMGGAAFRELGVDGIEPTVHDPWRGKPGAGDPGMALLIKLVDRLLVGDPPDAERVVETMTRRIAVAVAEARAAEPPTRRWVTPMRLWDPTSFAKGAENSPEQVRTRSAPPRSAARAPEKRDVRVGQIQPHDPSEYNVPDGEMPL